MSRMIDLAGMRFGRLVILARDEKIAGTWYWRCACDCGAKILARGSNLRSGNTQSCGCSRLTHGHAYSGTYASWRAMLSRTTNPNHPRWADWGGRGIRVCERWKTFENFLADMGERPAGLSIDRIDNDRGYEASNCRWATWVEQANNRRPRSKSLALSEGSS